MSHLLHVTDYHANILPSSGQANNIAQQKQICDLALDFIFHSFLPFSCCLSVVLELDSVTEGTLVTPKMYQGVDERMINVHSSSVFFFKFFFSVLLLKFAGFVLSYFCKGPKQTNHTTNNVVKSGIDFSNKIIQD